jgi:hypothetical protein
LQDLPQLVLSFKPKAPQSGGFNSTDSLVLLAIISYRNNAGASEAEIADFCDMVDHRIITDEELEGAVSRLRASKLIEERQGLYYPTRSVIQSIASLPQRKAWLEQWEIMSRFLRVQS